MSGESVGVDLAPITDDDIGAVAAFLHQHLNARLSADEWARCAVPPWSVDAPNHGFLLRHGDEVVGAYLAFYSERLVDGELRRRCNLAAPGPRSIRATHPTGRPRARPWPVPRSPTTRANGRA